MTFRSIAHVLQALLIFGIVLWEGAAQAQTLTGTVLDSAGAAIVGADIIVNSKVGTLRSASSAGGRFIFENVSPPVTVSARWKGFTTATETWLGRGEVTLVLRPATVQQQLVVAATRSGVPLGEVAASVTRLGADEIASTSSLQIDQLLRAVPGFSLFRRSDSRIANPTSQGVSLRGLGASGASRALVLYDDVPLNDPFAGWVYWDRVPSTTIDAIEVLRGGASALYGSGALAGIVNIARRQAETPLFSADVSAGNQGLQSGSVAALEPIGKWRISASAQAMRTDGYVPVPASLRGRADAAANVRYGTVRLRVDRRLGDSNLFASGNLFNESRQNGTNLQTNSTRLGEVIAGLDAAAYGGQLVVRGYGSWQRFNQTFSSIAADRNTESLVRVQAVPAHSAGISTRWTRPLGNQQSVTFGADARGTGGHSDEVLWAAAAPSARVDAGGRQNTVGLFAEDTLRITPRLHINGAARLDWWRNYNALSTATSLIASPVPNQRHFADRSTAALSPSLGGVFQVTRLLAVTGSAYGAFRAPTLNELYRAFRLGNVQTLANDALRAERLWGGETGLLVGSERIFARANFFWNTIHNAIGNRTLTIASSLITRERQNIGTLVARGIELEAQAALPARVRVRAAYQYSDSTVSHSLDNALVGLAIPQVPRHAVSTEVIYLGSRWGATVLGRYVGRQFEDDQNQLVLPGYFTADAMLRCRLSPVVEAFGATENLLDRTYIVGRTPLPSLGAPRLLRAGLRLRWPGSRNR